MRLWIERALTFFLGMTAVYYFLSYRLAIYQTNQALQLLQTQVQAQVDVLKNECVTLLGRQGYQVTRIPPPPPPEEEEEVKDEEDAER